MPSNLLPPELYQINLDANKTTYTIHTALDQLVLTQENPTPAGAVAVAPDLHLVVYADTVIVSGPVSLPGKNISIFARVIGLQKDSSNNSASIDVSGAPAAATAVALPKLPQAARGDDLAGDDKRGGNGTNGSTGATGATGANGNNAGNITLYMETDFQAGTTISLLANGSLGAPGANGSAGQDGGDGGTGENERSVPGTRGRGNTPGKTGGDGGNGGNGGNGGTGGKGGSGGTITANAHLTGEHYYLNDLTLTVSASGGGGGNGGNGGVGGNGGQVGSAGDGRVNGPDPVPGVAGTPGAQGSYGSVGPGGSLRIATLTDITLQPWAAQILKLLAPTPMTKMELPIGPGMTPIYLNFGEFLNYYALLGIVRGSPPGTAVEGQVMYDDLAVHASATQRSMTLQKAKLLYQMACPPDPDSPDQYSNPGAYDQAATLLTWLVNTTAFFATTPPPAPPTGFTADDVAMMASINAQATALACQLTLKRDFYGHLPSYVPQGSLTFYKDQLSKMLGDTGTFKAIEDNYIAYTNALAQQQATSQQLTTAQSQAQTMVGNLGTQQGNAVTNANSLITVIDADEDAVENQERILRRALQHVEDDLARFAGPSCALDSMLKALNMVATYTDNTDLKLANTIAGTVNSKALQPSLAAAVGSQFVSQQRPGLQS